MTYDLAKLDKENAERMSRYKAISDKFRADSQPDGVPEELARCDAMDALIKALRGLRTTRGHGGAPHWIPDYLEQIHSITDSAQDEGSK
jgi:hypothetical protein